MKIQKYLKQSPIFAINCTYEVLIPKINKQLKSEKINLLQGLVLTALFFESDGEKITPKQLAEIFQTSPGNISHIISALEYNGYVKRKLSSTDARKYYIELRPEGRRKAISLIKYFDGIQAGLELSFGAVGCQRLAESIHQMGLAFKNGTVSRNKATGLSRSGEL